MDKFFNAMLSVEYNELPQLLFANPIFTDGVNLSVRRGDKWFGVKELTLWDLKGNTYGRVNTFTSKKPFALLSAYPDADSLKYEHDPNCRTYAGLLKDMKEVYEGFDPTELVTLVWFICDFRE